MAYGKFTSQNIDELQNQLNMFLRQIGANRGIDFKIIDTKHSDVSVSLKILGVLNSPEAQRAIELEHKALWNKSCKELGLKETDFGLVVKIEDRTFKVSGLNEARGVVFLTETTGERKTFACSPLAFLKAKLRGKGNDEETN